MLLVIDVGNTNSVLGVYAKSTLVKSWRMKTDRLATGDELAMKLRLFCQSANISLKDIDDVIISSVVPPFMPALEYMVSECFGKEPIVVGPGIKTGLALLYDNPKEIGADRVVNAVAGLKKYGGPLIIVDFGTATTFCAIDGAGRYLGGAICPGIGISTEALFQRAAKLPRIELVKPDKAIAKNTVNAMQSGILFGYVGLVEGLVNRIKDEMNSSDIKVVATGGLAELISSETDSIDYVDPNLTLEGLRIIYERNQK